MAEERSRRRQPFGFLFPSWTSPSRASRRPRQQPQQQPPPIPSQWQDSQPPPQTSRPPTATATQPDSSETPSPLTTDRSPETPAADQVAVSQPPPSPTKSPPPEEESSVTKESLQVQDLSTEINQHDSSGTPSSSPMQSSPETPAADQIAPSQPPPPPPPPTKSPPPEEEEAAEATVTGEKILDQDLSTEISQEKAEMESKSKQAEEQLILREAPAEHRMEAESKREKSPARISPTEEICTKEDAPRITANTPEAYTVNQVIEDSKKIDAPKLSITVSDSNPTPKDQEILPEPDRSGEPATSSFNGSKKHSSAGKERQITISTKPYSSSPNPENPTRQKELKEGLSKLAQKLSVGHHRKLGNEQGLNIITLASENNGASMFIGHESSRREAPLHIHKGNSLLKGSSTGELCQKITASINSNVQGINSSILDETNYNERNPGVHMIIFAKPAAAASDMAGTKSAAMRKVASSITLPQKLNYEPGIRRRCLRGLLLESSEDDMEDSQKLRRHGCRFTCDDKGKGKMANSGT